MRGKLTIRVRLSYVGPVADGEALIAGLRSAATPLVDNVTTMPVDQIATISNDPTDPGTSVESNT